MQRSFSAAAPGHTDALVGRQVQRDLQADDRRLRDGRRPGTSVRAAADAGRGRPPSGAPTAYATVGSGGPMTPIDLRSDTVTPSAGCAPRWPRPRSATTSSATRRSTASRSASRTAGQGSRALVPDRHDGQPGRPADADLAGRRRHRLPREPRGLARDRRQRRERRRPVTEIGRAARSRGPSSRQPSSPRATSSPADDARRGREHPQPRRGRCRPQADAEAVANAARELGVASYSTAPDSGTRRSSSGAAWRSSPLGSTS